MQGKAIAFALKFTVNTLKSADFQDFVPQGQIANRQADVLAFVVQGPFAYNAAQHGAVQPDILGAGKGQRLAGLRLNRADFLAELAGVLIH